MCFRARMLDSQQAQGLGRMTARSVGTEDLDHWMPEAEPVLSLAWARSNKLGALGCSEIACFEVGWGMQLDDLVRAKQ